MTGLMRAMVLALITAVVSVHTGCSRPAGVRELANELGDRPLEGRLSGAIEYKPLRETVRGPATTDLPISARVAVARLERRAETQDTPDAAAAVGVGYLLIGRLDEGLSAL